jgi:hypothetical protein
MDLKSVREEAIAATNRAFWDRQGFVPAEDSEEWEREYRRQFEQVKARHAAAGTRAAGPAPAAPAARPLPELSGTPEQKRWAAAIRADRLGQIREPPIRAWLAREWTRARAWIDTRELSPEAFGARAAVWYAEHCRRAAEKVRALSAARASEAAAAAALKAEVAAAGITAEGLVELVDASERAEPAAITGKLAEIAVDGRILRLYETANPAVLLVKEKSREGHAEYGIAREEDLVADLKLYARAAALS